MTRFLVSRMLWSVLAILGVSTIVFVVLHLSGDPAALLLPPTGTKEDYEELRRLLGLDRPLIVQYAGFVIRAVRGDFARSFQYDEPAREVVLQHLPATIELTAMAIALIVFVAVPLGVLSAVFRNSWLDYLTSALTLAGQAAPNFWLGVMLILFFAVELRWVPTSGRGTIAHVVLPAVTLALQPVAKIIRLTRSEVLDVLGREFIRTARAKGLSNVVVILRHTLRNASIAIVTVIGLDLGYLLGGAIITESVFGWPGMGLLAITAINNRDFPVVQATVFIIALIVVAVNLAVDLMYVYLDPRVRLE